MGRERRHAQRHPGPLGSADGERVRQALPAHGRRRVPLVSDGRGALGAIVAGALLLAGCASIPGATRQEQLETTTDLVKRTLADLERQYPDAQAPLDSAVGIVVMSNKIVKIPLLGGGAGYGVAIDRAKGDTTYLKMGRFDIGMGWGARSVRPVMLFHDAGKFTKYIDGEWDATIGAEASAKVGEAGAAGGGG